MVVSNRNLLFQGAPIFRGELLVSGSVPFLQHGANSWGPKLDGGELFSTFFRSRCAGWWILSSHRNQAKLRSPGLKVKLLVGPTCEIPPSTQRSYVGNVRRSPIRCAKERLRNNNKFGLSPFPIMENEGST